MFVDTPKVGKFQVDEKNRHGIQVVRWVLIFVFSVR